MNSITMNPFPDLPYDIIFAILKKCDRETLSSLSLLSKSFNETIEPLLWRTIWFPLEERVQMTLAFCQAITRRPRRASCVRTLIFGLDYEPPLLKAAYCTHEAYYPPRIHGNPFVATQNALKLLLNLEFLEFRCSDIYSRVSGRPYGWAFCSALSSLAPPYPSVSSSFPTYPFQLKRLKLSCAVYGLADFLASEPSITILETERPVPFWQNDLSSPSPSPSPFPSNSSFLPSSSPPLHNPSPLLPNLTAVSGRIPFLLTILPSHPHIARIRLLSLSSLSLTSLISSLVEILEKGPNIRDVIFGNNAQVDLGFIIDALEQKGKGLAERIERFGVGWRSFERFWEEKGEGEGRKEMRENWLGGKDPEDVLVFVKNASRNDGVRGFVVV